MLELEPDEGVKVMHGVGPVSIMETSMADDVRPRAAPAVTYRRRSSTGVTPSRARSVASDSSFSRTVMFVVTPNPGSFGILNSLCTVRELESEMLAHA